MDESQGTPRDRHRSASGSEALERRAHPKREHAAPKGGPSFVDDLAGLPALLTADEVAAVLRTTRGAVYARAERRQLPGLIRDGRRLLFERAAPICWLEERRVASPGET